MALRKWEMEREPTDRRICIVIDRTVDSGVELPPKSVLGISETATSRVCEALMASATGPRPFTRLRSGWMASK